MFALHMKAYVIASYDDPRFVSTASSRKNLCNLRKFLGKSFTTPPPPPPGKKYPVHNAYGHVGEYPIMFSSFFILSSHVSYSPINSKVQQPTPQAFQLLKIGSFKCFSLSSTLSVKCPLQEESSAPVVSNKACAYTCQHMFRDRLYDYGSFTVT